MMERSETQRPHSSGEYSLLRTYSELRNYLEEVNKTQLLYDLAAKSKSNCHRQALELWVHVSDGPSNIARMRDAPIARI